MPCVRCALGVPCTAPPHIRRLAEDGTIRISNIWCPRDEPEPPYVAKLRSAGAVPDADDNSARWVIEISERAQCGCCVYKPGEDRKTCSICLELMCKGGGGFDSVCSTCSKEHPVDELYPEVSASGRRLDPEKGFALPTCKCGQVIRNESPCFYAALQGSTEHAPLPIEED